MTKKSVAKLSDGNGQITITFDLFDLPTAQHKAGLAGLLLEIESMRNRNKVAPSYQWHNSMSRTKVEVDFTKETFQSLFDDVYAAEVVKDWFRQKKTKEHLIDQRSVSIAGKNIKEYQYDVIRPTLPILRHYLSGPSGDSWLRLWQQMLWAVPRGVNTTRIPFEVVAGWDRKRSKEQRRVSSQPSPEGQNAWSAIISITNPSSRKKVVDAVNGRLWLGSQETTAETLAFLGRVDQNLLLHFWHFASLIYIPQSFKVVREKGRVEAKRRYDGYAIAIPDVTDLRLFVDRFPETLQALARESAPPTGRPRSAIVEVPSESALSLLDRDRATGIAQQKATGGEFRYTISGVDYLHFRPGKNGPRMLSAGRIGLRAGLAEDYEIIAGRLGEKPPYRNSLFRRACMLALLDELPWYHPFGKLFAEWPHEFFVNTEASPQKLAWFWTDARKKMKEIEQSMKTDHQETLGGENEFLAATISRFVRQYLDERLRADGYNFPAYRKAKNTPPDAAKSRRELAERLFLEFRSRHGQAFIAHFTGTFCRVGQYFGLSFEKIAPKLMSQTDDVKT